MDLRRKQADRDRSPKRSDRDVSADEPKSSRESPALLMAQSDVAELFDGLARERFGHWISTAQLRAAKGNRKRPP
jgi:hypothetical protein